MRPGRLDRILYVGPPDQQGREEIMRIRTRHMKIQEDLDIAHIAKIVSDGWSKQSVGLSSHYLRRRKAAPVQK